MTFDHMFFTVLIVSLMLFAQGEYYRRKLKYVGERCQQLINRSKRYVEMAKAAYEHQANEVNKAFRYFRTEIARLREEFRIHGILSNHNLGFSSIEELNTTCVPLPPFTLDEDHGLPVSGYILSNDNYHDVQVNICCFVNFSETSFKVIKSSLKKYNVSGVQC